MPVKKIVVIGPESTGKSTLCEQLAAYYDTVWAKEYAREYLLKNGSMYSFDQLLDIARGQLKLEDECVENAVATDDRRPTTVFIDTDMYVMKIWGEFVFDDCHRWILNQIATRKYDLYLLCNVDLPWVKDELREYPDLVSREKLYGYYKDAMINQQTPWINISGTVEERFQKAVDAVNYIVQP